MLRFHDALPPAGAHELVLWTSSAGDRCVLVSANHTMELQLIHDGAVQRHEIGVDPRGVRELAQRWRLDYELAHRQPDHEMSELCPECGEDAPPATPGATRRRSCAACGHEWAGAPSQP